MSKIDFQDDGYCGHLGSAHLAILCLLGTLMLIIKFQFKWIIEEVQNMNSQHFPY